MLHSARVGLFSFLRSAPASRKPTCGPMEALSPVNPDAGSRSSHCPYLCCWVKGWHLKRTWEGAGHTHTIYCRGPTTRAPPESQTPTSYRCGAVVSANGSQNSSALQLISSPTACSRSSPIRVTPRPVLPEVLLVQWAGRPEGDARPAPEGRA